MEISESQKRKWVRIPFPKGSAEYLEEKRRRARVTAKEKYQRMKAMDIAEDEENNQLENPAPPMPRTRMPMEWNVPDDLRAVLGEKITLGSDWTGWPIFHVRRQETLSQTTRTQYSAYYHRLPRSGDIWSVTRFIMSQNPATQNMFAKSGLSYACESLYNSLYVTRAKVMRDPADYKSRLLNMMVYSKLNKLTKKESYDRHISQEASDERLEATVPWEEWKKLGERYLRSLMSKDHPPLTEKEKKDALLVWAYSQLPPVRLDWNDIKVVRVKNEKDWNAKIAAHKEGNAIYWFNLHVAICWAEFKNAAQFKDLPVCTRIVKSYKLEHLLRTVLPPGNSEPLKIPNFSKYLTKLAQDITGKPFTNRLMRSSYIRWFHENHDTKDLKAVKAMMRDIHQTNLEVHLGYIKHATTDGDLTD